MLTYFWALLVLVVLLLMVYHLSFLRVLTNNTQFATKMCLLHGKGFGNLLGCVELVEVSEVAGYLADFYSDCCLGSKGPCLEKKSTVQA